MCRMTSPRLDIPQLCTRSRSRKRLNCFRDKSHDPRITSRRLKRYLLLLDKRALFITNEAAAKLTAPKLTRLFVNRKTCLSAAVFRMSPRERIPFSSASSACLLARMHTRKMYGKLLDLRQWRCERTVTIIRASFAFYFNSYQRRKDEAPTAEKDEMLTVPRATVAQRKSKCARVISLPRFLPPSPFLSPSALTSFPVEVRFPLNVIFRTFDRPDFAFVSFFQLANCTFTKFARRWAERETDASDNAC
ncbi:hypothetical protein PUN28_014397 [Cardiocondyla obscurior]|uniref:Uncharacterized protein n=1 Tax=Cardiocondyla obscurior TaxID=286306 RepID=A0AAW2F444_9HYME